jgi:formate--tetrahydrofolate ligase
LQNISRFGVPAVVCINHFSADTDAEAAVVIEGCKEMGVTAIVCRHWAQGGAGAVDLAKAVVDTIERTPSTFHPLYPDDLPLMDKIKTIASDIYGATDVVAPKSVIDRLAELEKNGFGRLPICVEKTQYSFSADPELRGAPTGFTLPIREVRLSAGAEFVVVICGDIMTMPGLPKVPSAKAIRVDAEGAVFGLS